MTLGGGGVSEDIVPKDRQHAGILLREEEGNRVTAEELVHTRGAFTAWTRAVCG